MQHSRSYWSFLRQAKGRHGVHSPFVFQLVDTCLTTKVDKNFNILRKKWYAELKRDREPFQVIDLGAGSKQLSQTRTKRQLLMNSSSSGIYGDILYQLGDVNGAVIQWEKARGMNAKSEVLNKKIANRKIYE